MPAPKATIWGVLTKTYGQMCPLARSLDVLGERWTILVIRELLLGPKRFKHLLAALPGIGSNRLAERLKVLEDSGIVRKTTLPAPAAVPVYELTAEGERLREPLVALGLWGLDLPVDERIDPQTSRGELIALCLSGTQTKLLDPRRRDTYEFHVGDEVFHFQLRQGNVPAPQRPGADGPHAEGRLRPSDLHRPCAAKADSGTGGDTGPRHHFRRYARYVRRSLPRAGLHPAGAVPRAGVTAAGQVTESG